MKITTFCYYSLTASLLFALTAANQVMTPTPTTTAPYNEELQCWPISVEHDATYCIDGPICSGSGPSPIGSLCPVKGNVAIADCHTSLSSHSDGDQCLLQVNATCQIIKTGVWGCVTSGDDYPTKYEDSTSASTYGNGSNDGSGSYGNGSAVGNETISLLAAGTETASAGGVSVGVIGAIAAVAAAVAAIAGVAIYRQHIKKEKEDKTMVEVVTP